MDWNEDEICNLIESYKKTGVLWDPTNPNYFRRELKFEAWQNLAAKVNRSEEECRRKMSSLLSSYRRERGRERRAKKKGGGGRFSSRWFAYEAMRFLESRGTAPIRKLQLNKIDDYVDEELNGLDEDEEPFELYPIQTTIEEGFSGSEGESLTNSSRRLIEETNNQAAKRFRVEEEPVARSELVVKSEPHTREESMLASAADLMKSTATALNRDRETCEVKTFCDFLKAKMLNYSKNTNRSVQHAVFQILMQADQGAFEKDKQTKSSDTP